jgi:hypothetical protein
VSAACQEQLDALPAYHAAVATTISKAAAALPPLAAAQSVNKAYLQLFLPFWWEHVLLRSRLDETGYAALVKKMTSRLPPPNYLPPPAPTLHAWAHPGAPATMPAVAPAPAPAPPPALAPAYAPPPAPHQAPRAAAPAWAQPPGGFLGQPIAPLNVTSASTSLEQGGVSLGYRVVEAGGGTGRGRPGPASPWKVSPDASGE